MFSDSDKKLMEQVAVGDLTAFSQLFDAYAPSLMEFGLRLHLETAVAEQIVQETFWAVWQQAEHFHSQTNSFPLWLRQLARQVSLNNFRVEVVTSSKQMMEVHREQSG